MMPFQVEYLKVKPLVVPSGVDIILHDQIICFDLIVLHSIRIQQIATFEIRIKS